MTVNALNYRDQGGAVDHVGGRHIIESGGTQEIASGAQEKLLGAVMPAQVSVTPAAGASNVSELTFQVKDAAGNAIARVFNLLIWLSDAASGAGLTGTTASGAVAAKAASGVDLATHVAKKCLLVQTLATGAYILSITDTAKTGFYPCSQLGDLPVQVGAQLVAGNYGA